jgi:pimeloyl-ACP methyl ester carboxylesterase
VPVFPLPLTIGSGDCVAGGDTFASRAPEDSVFNGFLLGCWSNAFPDNPVHLSDIPLTQRSIIVAQANIVNLLYTDVGAATTAAIALLGPGTTVVVTGSGVNDLSPITLIAFNNDIAIVFVTGTTNYQQLALQGMFSLIPPSSMSGYGSNAFWEAVSNIINARIVAAGVPANAEIRIVGHSYGAASGTLTAAKIKRFTPGRVVELLTFGMPKPGDARLSALLGSIPSVNIVMATDPIPSLPPSLEWLLPFIPLVEGSILDGWAQYRPPPNQFILTDEGALTPSNDATFSILQLGVLIADALVTSYPPAFPARP